MTPPNNHLWAMSDCHESTHPSTGKKFSRNGTHGLINFMMLFVVLTSGVGLWLGLSLKNDQPSKLSSRMLQANPAALAPTIEAAEVVVEDDLAVR